MKTNPVSTESSTASIADAPAVRILAIESSCDETAAAVVENGRGILSSIVASQADLHARYGGVFPEVASARYLAALVPFAITAQFALVGLGVMKDPAAVEAMSRTGDRREILRGPLFYGIIFVVLTILFNLFARR